VNDRWPTERAAGAGEDGLAGRAWVYDDEFPLAEEPTTADATAGLVSFTFLRSAVRRRRRLWFTTAAIGLLAGAALFATSKPGYQVTVSLLVASAPGADGPTAVQTEALRAQDPAFARLMMKELGLSESPSAFLQTYTVTEISGQVLSIVVTAPAEDAATSRATTIATGFLQFRAGELRAENAAVAASEDQQVTDQQHVVSQLDSQVSKAQSSSGTRSSALRGLRAEQAKAATVLADLQQSVAGTEAQNLVTTDGMISGSAVLSVSNPIRVNSRTKTALTYLGGGVFGGVVLGIAIAGIGAVVSTRLRRRDDVAAALGAPVKISVTASEAGDSFSVGKRGRGRRDSDSRRLVRYIHDSVPVGSRSPASLAIVAVDNAKIVGPLVMDTAADLAQDGRRVVVADLTGGAVVSGSEASEPGVHMIDVHGRRIALIVPDSGDIAPVGPVSRNAHSDGARSEAAAAYAVADVMLTVTTLDPAVGADHLRTWAGDAVAVITAGLSSEMRITAVGEMTRNAGLQLRSAALLGADPSDESLGALADFKPVSAAG